MTGGLDLPASRQWPTSTASCSATSGQPHSCDDPARCAIDELIRGDDDLERELEELRDVIDQIRELIAGKKTISTRKIEEILP